MACRAVRNIGRLPAIDSQWRRQSMPRRPRHGLSLETCNAVRCYATGAVEWPKHAAAVRLRRLPDRSSGWTVVDALRGSSYAGVPTQQEGTAAGAFANFNRPVSGTGLEGAGFMAIGRPPPAKVLLWLNETPPSCWSGLANSNSKYWRPLSTAVNFQRRELRGLECVWIVGFGDSQINNGNVIHGSNNTSSNIYGTLIGVNYRFSPNTIVGFGFAVVRATSRTREAKSVFAKINYLADMILTLRGASE